MLRCPWSRRKWPPYSCVAAIAQARFYSFTDAEENTKEQIQKARSHPWISPEVPIRGFVYDVSTGRLSEVFPDGETVTS